MSVLEHKLTSNPITFFQSVCINCNLLNYKTTNLNKKTKQFKLLINNYLSSKFNKKNYTSVPHQSICYQNLDDSCTIISSISMFILEHELSSNRRTNFTQAVPTANPQTTNLQTSIQKTKTSVQLSTTPRWCTARPRSGCWAPPTAARSSRARRAGWRSRPPSPPTSAACPSPRTPPPCTHHSAAPPPPRRRRLRRTPAGDRRRPRSRWTWPPKPCPEEHVVVMNRKRPSGGLTGAMQERAWKWCRGQRLSSIFKTFLVFGCKNSKLWNCN